MSTETANARRMQEFTALRNRFFPRWSAGKNEMCVLVNMNLGRAWPDVRQAKNQTTDQRI
jgi:hypothetical protein